MNWNFNGMLVGQPLMRRGHSGRNDLMIADVNGEAYTINWYYIIQTFIGKEQESD
jgi:hypothetical protein